MTTMQKEESLSILGFQQQPVPNTFFLQINAADHLAIVLPGAGYNARMPLLYYTVNLFLERNADVLTVDYEYRTAASRNDPIFQQKLTENVLAAIKAGLQQRRYESVTLIGKSVGTRAMSWILTHEHNPLVGVPNLKTVWLTPVWTDPQIFPLMRLWKGPALHVIGTADQYYYDEDCGRQILQSKSASVVTVEGADHSLDIDGDIEGSLAAIHTSIKAIDHFVFEK